MKKTEKTLWEMFWKTGDPLYFTMRSILKEQAKGNYANNRNPGDRD